MTGRKDCVCKRARHEHGTRQAYISDGCRCDDCRRAHTAAKNRRVRLTAYGQLPPKRIPAIGTRRRIGALMTQGWSINALSRMCGWNSNRLHIYMTTDCGISPANAARIAALYDELWNRQAPRDTRHERTIYARTVNFAAARGYLPPLMLDDDAIDTPEGVVHIGYEFINPERDGTDATDDLEMFIYSPVHKLCTPESPALIDEIAVERAMNGERMPLTKAELSHAIDRLTGMGYSADMTAARLGVSDRLVQRYRAKGRAA